MDFSSLMISKESETGSNNIINVSQDNSSKPLSDNTPESKQVIIVRIFTEENCD